ncbi:double-stranded RNA-specific editase Adar isoform X6 [Drosophila montana]|uniref:double-stranded RNA-specific editase Adar isoform X6 n=1 Tax=Drosophila montana TaxID=40370 RepID=UPI00313C4376
MNGYNRKSPQKRRYDMPKYAVPPKKKSSKERVPQPKNTVAMLNELRHGLIYKLESQTGPVHAPLFTISVEVDGQKYMGQGRSKKVARIEAAATALRSFIQFKDGAVLSPLKSAGNLDFTSDEHLENGIENVSKAKLVELIYTLMLPAKKSNLTSLEQPTLRPQIFCMSHSKCHKEHDCCRRTEKSTR